MMTLTMRDAIEVASAILRADERRRWRSEWRACLCGAVCYRDAYAVQYAAGAFAPWRPEPTAPRESLAQRVARTGEDPDALGAKWDPATTTYVFPDGSAGAWDTLLDGAEQRDGLGRPVFHFNALAGEVR